MHSRLWYKFLTYSERDYHYDWYMQDNLFRYSGIVYGVFFIVFIILSLRETDMDFNYVLTVWYEDIEQNDLILMIVLWFFMLWWIYCNIMKSYNSALYTFFRQILSAWREEH